MYWQGSDKPTDRIKPTGWGASAHGAMPRGCPMPVLQGGHCCWKTLPGTKLTQPQNKINVPSLTGLQHRAEGVPQAAIPAHKNLLRIN